jgi:epsin
VAEALVSYSRLSHLEKLRDRFEFKEASGRDQGINVRQRAGALVSLVQDSNKLAEERDKVRRVGVKGRG